MKAWEFSFVGYGETSEEAWEELREGADEMWDRVAEGRRAPEHDEDEEDDD